jgi:hypothetical protein
MIFNAEAHSIFYFGIEPNLFRISDPKRTRFELYLLLEVVVGDVGLVGPLGEDISVVVFTTQHVDPVEKCGRILLRVLVRLGISFGATVTGRLGLPSALASLLLLPAAAMGPSQAHRQHAPHQQTHLQTAKHTAALS